MFELANYLIEVGRVLAQRGQWRRFKLLLFAVLMLAQIVQDKVDEALFVLDLPRAASSRRSQESSGTVRVVAYLL